MAAFLFKIGNAKSESVFDTEAMSRPIEAARIASHIYGLGATAIACDASWIAVIKSRRAEGMGIDCMTTDADLLFARVFRHKFEVLVSLGWLHVKDRSGWLASIIWVFLVAIAIHESHLSLG